MSRAMQFDIVANDKATATMGNVEKSMEKFGKGFASNLTAIASRATAIYSTLKTITAVINEGGNISDEAARLGVTVEMYQKLKFAANEYGSSIEEIAKAQKDVNKLLDAAATKKTGPEMQTLQALGFSDSDIINRNVKQAEVWERIGEAIKGAATQEEKFAVASRVFGDKISTSMIPVLENYGSFNSMMNSTVTISQKSADNLDRLGTKLNGFWQFTKALAQEGMGKVAGALMDEDYGNVPATAKQVQDQKAMAKAVLAVGADKATAAKGAGAGEVTSMAAVGAASFRGFPQVAAKPIEEQQLTQLERIADNTSPPTTPPPATPGGTDMSKNNSISDAADAIRRATGKTMMERFIRPAR